MRLLLRRTDVTFGLDNQGHVVSRVMALPELPQPRVGVDVVQFGLVLQGVCITCKHHRGGRNSHPHGQNTPSENSLPSLGLIMVKHIKNT